MSFTTRFNNSAQAPAATHAAPSRACGAASALRVDAACAPAHNLIPGPRQLNATQAKAGRCGVDESSSGDADAKSNEKRDAVLRAHPTRAETRAVATAFRGLADLAGSGNVDRGGDFKHVFAFNLSMT